MYRAKVVNNLLLKIMIKEIYNDTSLTFFLISQFTSIYIFFEICEFICKCSSNM